MFGEAVELFAVLVPVHLLKHHPVWLHLTSRAWGMTNSGLNRTSQRRRDGFQGLFRTSIGQEGFHIAIRSIYTSIGASYT